jgi:glycerophosphoryl diester phosphodiesterase
MPLSLLGPIDALVAPPPTMNRVAFLKTVPFAHRGLHGGAVVENSRAAFAAAIAVGHGFELDVQESAGYEAWVFHDARLERLTREVGNFRDKTESQLERIILTGTDEAIPRLSDVLRMTQGQVPVLIEIKCDGGRVNPLCLAVRRALEGYRGPFAIMSFNPLVVRWFHDHAERMVRGLVITERDDAGKKMSLWQRLKRHMMLWTAKPDFLAYDIRDLPSRFAAAQRKRGLPVLTWTVRDAAQERTALQCADQPIYEKPSPASR